MFEEKHIFFTLRTSLMMLGWSVCYRVSHLHLNKQENKLKIKTLIHYCSPVNMQLSVT